MEKISATASARKSLGEFKPLIVYPNGHTEVCEKSPERVGHHTRQGYIPGKRYARGTTYKTRDEAVAVAQAWIDARREDALRRYEAFLNHPSERIRNSAQRVLLEAQVWGHQV